ncbi:MAG: hypothetical protein RBS80_13380 [Thermoguttaceae bacterium]|jgi:hypothetical protein|nr:hypothetical protein [Thermoguttaceae bacterium]
MPSLETDILLELICSKRTCLEQLQAMGRRQMELIESDQMSALLDLLAQKQQTIAELQQIERGLDPFRDQAPEARRWRNEEARRRCADELSACEGLLAGIIDGEKASERALVLRRDEAATRLQGMHRAGRARASYISPPAATASQIDLCSDAS